MPVLHSLTSLAVHHEATARVLERYQVHPNEVFRAAGLDPEPYRDPDSRISITNARKIWSQAVRLTGNPDIGFEVGAAARITNLHAVGFAWLASRTLADALRRLVRHQRMLTSAVELELTNGDNELYLHFDGTRGWPQQGVDAIGAAVIAMCREVTYEDFAPARVEFMRMRPTHPTKVKRYFGCVTNYQAPHNVLVFRSSQVSKFLPRQNPAIAQASDEVAARYVARMDRADVVGRAELGLIEILTMGNPSRAGLAEHLHMSERTLSRRLQESGITFRELLDGVREELAREYMLQSEYSVADVCFLLGFTDQSNFAKAFKRWTGLSPTAYRRDRFDGRPGG